MDNCSRLTFDLQLFGKMVVWTGSPGTDEAHSGLHFRSQIDSWGSGPWTSLTTWLEKKEKKKRGGS